MRNLAQSTRRRQRFAAQLLPLLLLILVFLSSLVLFIVAHAHHLQQAVLTQAAADHSALAAARMQAHVLNLIGVLNVDLERSRKLSEAILTTWAALAACAGACIVVVGCVCVPPLQTYTVHAPRLLKKIRSYAENLAKVQQRLIHLLPALTLMAARRIAGKNDTRLNHLAFARANRQPLPLFRGTPEDLTAGKRCHQTKPRQHQPRGVRVCQSLTALLEGPFTLPAPLRLDAAFVHQAATTGVQVEVKARPKTDTNDLGHAGKYFSADRATAWPSVVARAAAAPSRNGGRKPRKEDLMLMHHDWDATLIAAPLSRQH